MIKKEMKILEFFAAFLAIESLIITRGNSLTIDNQLVIIANDCYTRIAIGSNLPPKDIATSVAAVTVTECEDQCSRKRNTCEIFSFGISPKGNATCLLGTRIPDPDELVTNTDYDIYIRQQSSPSCMPDRLYKLGSGERNPTNLNNGEREVNVEKNENDTMRRPKPGRIPNIQNPVGGYGIVGTPNAEQRPDPPNENHQNYPNYPSYQLPQKFPNFPQGFNYPGLPTFDENNPNGPYTYANKNPYGIAGSTDGYKVQGNTNFVIGPANFYPAVHQPVDENAGDYYFDSMDSGNRYGANIYETPETVCKLINNYRTKILCRLISRTVTLANFQTTSR